MRPRAAQYFSMSASVSVSVAAVTRMDLPLMPVALAVARPLVRDWECHLFPFEG